MIVNIKCIIFMYSHLMGFHKTLTTHSFDIVAIAEGCLFRFIIIVFIEYADNLWEG